MATKVDDLQTYLVGGAVRDRILGQEVTDRDWVVLGATPQKMVALGFEPVGSDFPVFLHPQTKEEYALARTERKTAKGYHGFTFYAAPDVTLEQDLARRDLTINAMAQDAAGRLVDPYGGKQDLERKVLRHVSPAFSEDPVRVLRLARFYARFADFTVAQETMDLMREMVHSGEVDSLACERVWQEMARGLMEQTPSRMFLLLREIGALARLLPEVDALWGVPQRAEYHPEVDTGVHVMMVLDMAAELGYSLPVRFACLMHDLGKANTPPSLLPRHHGHEARSVTLLQGVCKRLSVPRECAQLAEIVAAEHGNIHRSLGFSGQALLRLLKRCDALRRPERFAAVLEACECDARGRLGYSQAPYPQKSRLWTALQSALAVETASIAAQAQTEGCRAAQIGQRIDAARVQEIERALPSLSQA